MKKIALLLLALISVSNAEVNFGMSAGAGIGLPIQFSFDKNTSSPEFLGNFMSAMILGEDQVFFIGVEYTYRKHTNSVSYTEEVTERWPSAFDNTVYTYTSTHPAWKDEYVRSHNIGLTMGMNLNRNPVWWTIGYDTYTKAPYFQSTLGLLASKRTSNNGILFGFTTYFSKSEFSAGLTLSIHIFGDSYKRDEGYENAGAIAGILTSFVAAGMGDSGSGDNKAYKSKYKNGSCSIYGCLCADGTMSYAENRQGACSWHGGILD